MTFFGDKDSIISRNFTKLFGANWDCVILNLQGVYVVPPHSFS